MVLPMFRIIVCVIVATAGCTNTTVNFGELGMLAPNYQGARIEVLASDVEGKHCVSVYSFTSSPSYGKALANALNKIPTANVMRDVSFEFQNRFLWHCTWVKGDAGKFQ